MIEVAQQTGVERLEAICHADHHPSARVLEKCGFEREGVLRNHTHFPNLDAGTLCDVLHYARQFTGQFSSQNETSAGSVTRSTD
jgi:RimJ/RimL family protein N-acetyltransferase